MKLDVKIAAGDIPSRPANCFGAWLRHLASAPGVGRAGESQKTVFFQGLSTCTGIAKKIFLRCLTGFFRGSTLQGLGGFQRRLKPDIQPVRRLIERAATDLVRATLQRVIPVRRKSQFKRTRGSSFYLPSVGAFCSSDFRFGSASSGHRFVPSA